MIFIRQELTGPPGRRNQSKRVFLKCEHCGSIVERAGYGSVNAESCGCIPHHKSKHGDAGKSKLYAVWHGIRDRCLNPKGKDWKRYGGRGIKCCKQWNSYVAFKSWALSHGWQDGLIMDRRDNNRGYYPSNCRFVSILVSNRNKSNITINAHKAKLIRDLLDALTNKQIADLLDVPSTTVKNIRSGVCWKE